MTERDAVHVEDDATTTVAFSTTASPKDACRTMHAQVVREVAPLREDATDPGCGWQAVLASVANAATVRIEAETAGRRVSMPGRSDRRGRT